MAKRAIIESLKGKVDQIIEENIRLRNEYDALLQQKTKLEKENRELKEQSADKERQLKKLELKSGFMANDDDKKRVKKRINQLMREIDKCIALMNEE